jgi:glycosyltransferase involved in cell wall biosynthesis
MKLLAVCQADEPGGAELGLLRLARRLTTRGWSVTLTTPSGGSLARSGYPWMSLDVGGLHAGEGARAVAAWPRARLLGRRHDVIYLNGTVAGRLLPALRGMRTVLHVHDVVSRVPRHWHGASVVLADSQAVADQLEGLAAHVVYCPVELDPPAVAPPWVDGDGPVVGFVGRIEPRKGVMDLVAAAPAIRAGGARVVIVGDDPYEPDSRYLAQVRAATGVEQPGWVADAAGLMGSLDVLVAPSHQEPFGTVLAEAMAAGTPVVATRVGGLAEVVQDGVTGRLVEPGDPVALAAAVREVLARRGEMGAAARAHARQFGADAYADRVEQVIRP